MYYKKYFTLKYHKNTRSAFARKHIFARANNMLFSEVTEDHHCYGFDKRYLDVFLCDRNIIQRIFLTNILYFRKFWEIFGNFPKMFVNDCLAFAGLLENLRKSSESVRNLRKIVKKVVISI